MVRQEGDPAIKTSSNNLQWRIKSEAPVTSRSERKGQAEFCVNHTKTQVDQCNEGKLLHELRTSRLVWRFGSWNAGSLKEKKKRLVISCEKKLK